MFAPSMRHPGVQHRIYVGASELRRMRQSPGSQLLEAVLAALPEPLALWTAEDIGVDEQGFYEFGDVHNHREPIENPI